MFGKKIHHHTGGLETRLILLSLLGIIHHHTGGLEKQRTMALFLKKIHHHTGGLESCLSEPLSIV